MHLDNKIGSICCYLSVLSTFSYAFPPRAESATFLFAAMSMGSTQFIPPKRRFWKTEQKIDRAISKYFMLV